MNDEIYREVHEIVCDLVNVSSADDTKIYWERYHALELICESNVGGEKNHPFQWETLADFTIDNKASLPVYERAFDLANGFGLNEYMASIKLALAERYLELGMHEKSHSCASSANEYAEKTEDLDLRKSVSVFLLSKVNDT